MKKTHVNPIPIFKISQKKRNTKIIEKFLKIWENKISMDLILNTKLGLRYKSNSQKIRVVTENWVLNQIYCPNCGDIIYSYNNNKPVADFYCKKCLEDFE